MSKIGEQTRKIFNDLFENPGIGRKLLEAQGLDPLRLQTVSAMDDEQPPIKPPAPTLTPFLGALLVVWEVPPNLDRVAKTVVEFRPPTGPVILAEENEGNVSLTQVDLEVVEYDVRIYHEDHWGRKSPWSDYVSATPLETAQYKIDLAKAQQLNTLSGLMPAINTDLIDGEEFAEGVIRQATLAQPDASNTLPLLEVDFQQWENGMVWPPPDTPKGSATPYVVPTAGNGVTASVEDKNGLNWLTISRSVASTGVLYQPFQFKPHGTIGTAEYIYSVYVQAVAGTQVALTVQAASDATGTGQIALANTGYQSIPAGANGVRLFVKFANDPTRPYTAMRILLQNPNTSASITKMQLEPSYGKSEPSPWTPGMISTGVVNARMLMALDVTAVNGIFKNGVFDTALIADAAITNAKIGDLQVNDAKIANMFASKLRTDSLTATTITLTNSGIIRSATSKVSFSGTGLNLSPASDYGSGIDAEYKISAGSWGALMWFDPSTNGSTRGFGLVSTTPSAARTVENIIEAKNITTGVRSLIATRVVPNVRADVLIWGPDGVTIAGQGLYINNDLEAHDIQARNSFYAGGNARVEQELWVDDVLTAEGGFVCTEGLYARAITTNIWYRIIPNANGTVTCEPAALPARQGNITPGTSDAGQRYSSALTY